MACIVENWSLKDLSDALCDKNKDKKRIAVPMFQRGTRWNKMQENTFIDSLKKGYPVGTMLFYQTLEDNVITYILVDGLQRGNTVRKYITQPTQFFDEKTISDELCQKLLIEIGMENSPENTNRVRMSLCQIIKSQKSYANIQYLPVALAIIGAFNINDPKKLLDCGNKISPHIQEYFESRQKIYSTIANTVIPVVVYNGNEENLTEIFARINSKGTPLDQYEVYAAAWPNERIIKTDNNEIIDAVIHKYDSMESGDFELYGYDPSKIKKERALTPFEYLFGLSKWLTQNVDILRFAKQKESDDEVNPLGFELVNICLNESNKIPELYKRINEIKDINKFEESLCSSIEFVQKAVSIITRFKGNNRKKDKVFHSKFQIMSMIATVFKEKYSASDYSTITPDWQSKESTISKNLTQYYVYDILTNYWSEGGTGKIYVAVPDRYHTTLTPRVWGRALNGYFELSMQKVESKKIPNPGNEEYVFLNCVYLQTFSAIDQLSADSFDVEHLATKDQMKKLISLCGGRGLAISSIANLCYLPEAANRSKGAKSLYQDKNYLKKYDLGEIENKYSFTEESELDWLDAALYERNDFPTLKEFYDKFCSNRFDKLKKKFCESLGIEFVDEANAGGEMFNPSVDESLSVKTGHRSNAIDTAAQKMIDLYPDMLFSPRSNRSFVDKNGIGYYFLHSKVYKRPNDRLYWYAYRREQLDLLQECREIKLCYVMDDDCKTIILSQKLIESKIKDLHKSIHTDGTCHWHIKFTRDNQDCVRWLIGHEGKGEKIIMSEIL